MDENYKSHNKINEEVEANMLRNDTPVEQRPPIWVGHISLNVSDFTKSLQFFLLLGMQKVALFPGGAVLELRGGTHLVLNKRFNNTSGKAEFDLMVEDLKTQRSLLQEAGYSPTPIKKGMLHSTFEVTEPSGNILKFFDTHVVGPV